MNKENIINYFILTIGTLLFLNAVRLLFAWMMGSDIFLKSDTPIIMLIWGPVLGITFIMLGSTGLKEQGFLSRFLKKWSGKFILIILGVIVLTLINLK